MISQETRQAILTLRQKETSINKIGKILKISRNTVRAVLRGKSAARSAPISSGTADVVDMAANLLPQCGGNVVRLREMLKERHDIDITYSTLTRLVREADLRENAAKRAGSYSFAPGEEAQHDTSPHRPIIGGRAVTAHCAALVLAYSTRCFIQYYPAFTRLEARHFLSKACCFMDGACPRWLIDNTSVIVAHGAGPDAQIAPEMEAFAAMFGARFVPHRVGDPNRKARVERIFSYAEGNFLAGRTFSDWHDLNLKAVQWCAEVANMKVKRSLGMSPEAAYLMEKPHLLALPPYLPPIYQALARVVDSEGFVHVDTNRYSVPERLVGKKVQVIKSFDRIEVFLKNQMVAQHERPLGMRDRRITSPDHHPLRPRPSHTGPSPEETALLGHSEVLDLFVAEIKKRSHGRGARSLKRLLDLRRTYPHGPFIAALTQALQFGLLDLARIEKMILSNIAGEFFEIHDEEDQ